MTVVKSPAMAAMWRSDTAIVLIRRPMRQRGKQVTGASSVVMGKTVILANLDPSAMLT